MVKCEKCGNTNQKKDEYCTECGNQIIINKCSSCNSTIKKNDRFCGKCGFEVINKKNDNQKYGSTQLIAKVGVKMDSSYHYYIDEKGNIARRKGEKKEIIAKVGVKKEEGYEYFINDRGDIARRKIIEEKTDNILDTESDDHVDLFLTKLNELISKGDSGFVIFKLIKKVFWVKIKKTPFVQFSQNNNKLELFFPNESGCYSSNCISNLENLLESMNVGYNKEDDGIYANFDSSELASKVTHKIFKEIFHCETEYEVDCEIALNG